MLTKTYNWKNEKKKKKHKKYKKDLKEKTKQETPQNRNNWWKYTFQM